jgi:predicted aspartyl protease
MAARTARRTARILAGSIKDMGKLTVRFIAVNYDDQSDVARKRTKRKPRQVEADALVDTGATRLYLQHQVIETLGLRPVSEVTSRTMSDREEKRIVFSPVELEIQGRKGLFDVIELPDTLPNIIGQIPLEHLDWVVDLKNRTLLPNPEHKHGEMSDEFRSF